MQGQIPFQKQPFLFTAGESAGEPGGESAAQDAQAGQAEEGQVQRVQAVRPLHHRTHKLDVENSPNKSTDAAGWKQDHLWCEAEQNKNEIAVITQHYESFVLHDSVSWEW